MNPLFNRFGGQPQQNPTMLEQFNEFASNFRGDPRQRVEDLVRSGRMSKQQFEEYGRMATQLQNLFRR